MSDKPKPMKTKETVDPESSSAVDFSFKTVRTKPKRRYRKGSKYDPILDAFLKSPEKLVEVSIPEKDANYVRTQLNKRIDVNSKYKKIKISVVNNVAYLEKD